jgi:predicted nucleic acid-binding protein
MNLMSAKYFLDTNIFVYSFDEGQPGKKARALELIGAALINGQGIISTQVIQEFLNVATRKFAEPLQIEDSKVYLRKVLAPLCEVYPDPGLYEACLDIQRETGYSFYDSLILAGALRGGCEILYSEDFQSGQQLGNLRIVNPFTEPGL